MSVIVRHNQSLLDIAVQEYGTAEVVFELATANGINVTDELVAGTSLQLPALTGNSEVLSYYKKYNIHPVTGSTRMGITPPPDESTEGCSWITIEW